jgi:hypothetical protein
VDSQPKTQRSGRGKTKYKHTVSNPNYSTGLGWKWGKRGRAPPFIGETLISPPMAARRVSMRVRADARSRARVDPRPQGRIVASAGKCGRGRTSGRTFSSKNVRYDIPGEDCIPARSFLSTRSSRLRNLIFLCAFLREHMCVAGCEQISFVSCCCEVLLSGFRVSGCEQVQEVGFVLTDRVLR